MILERETDRQTDRQTHIDVRKKHLSVASCMCPEWGSNPQPLVRRSMML